jgi:hypothetical protein
MDFQTMAIFSPSYDGDQAIILYADSSFWFFCWCGCSYVGHKIIKQKAEETSQQPDDDQLKIDTPSLSELN